MKIIDLLNKIAKGEEVPKEINVDGIFYEYNRWGNDYSEKDKTTNYWLFGDYTFGSNSNRLNSEVEIIEEEKEIEKFKEHNLINTEDILELEMFINKKFADYDCKINELIDVINDMRDKE